MPDTTRAVIHRGRALAIDPTSCRSLGAGVVVDATSVWFRENRLDLDPATTRRVGAYVWDAQRVYLLEDDGAAEEVDADGASLEVFASHFYARDARGIVFGNARIDLPGSVLDDLDGRRTRAFDAVLVLRDAVFVDGAPHPADPATVAAVGERAGSLSRPAFRYLVDRERVWPARADHRRIATWGRLLPDTLETQLEADPTRFRCEGDWAFDGERVWHLGTVVRDARPAGAVVLSDDWACLQEQIHYRTCATAADVRTFEVLGGDFGRDARRVWHAGEQVEELDGPSTVLCCVGGGLVGHGVETRHSLGVLRDRSGVWRLVYADSDYACGTYVAAIDGVDAGTFRIVDAEIGLAIDASGVWLVDERIHDDPTALVLLDGGYWHVAADWYWFTTRLRSLDALEHVFPGGVHAIATVRGMGTPRALGDGYLHTEAAMWHRSTRLEIDPTDAVSLGSGFVRNRDGVHHFEEIMTSRKVVEFESLGGRLDGADPSRFEVVGDNYGADARHVYHGPRQTEIDRASVQLLGGGWARDRTRIYCHGAPVDVDVASFRVLGGCRTNAYAGREHGAYAKDAHRVFRGGSILQDSYSLRDVEVNASAFELRGEFFAIDDRHVFALSRPQRLEGADPATFAALGGLWAKDAEHVYYDARRVTGAEARGCELLGDVYLRTASGVFVDGNLAQVDPDTLEAVGHGWARDATGLWHRGRRVDDADMATFGPSPLARGLMQDATTVHDAHSSVRPTRPPEACTSVGDGYWHDRTHLYFRAEELGPIDEGLVHIGGGFVQLGATLYFEGVELT